jgi:hypothetical protein
MEAKEAADEDETRVVARESGCVPSTAGRGLEIERQDASHHYNVLSETLQLAAKG